MNRAHMLSRRSLGERIGNAKDRKNHGSQDLGSENLGSIIEETRAAIEKIFDEGGEKVKVRVRETHA